MHSQESCRFIFINSSFLNQVMILLTPIFGFWFQHTSIK